MTRSRRRGVVEDVLRLRVYEILTTPRRDDVLGRALEFALMTLIAVNVAASVAETDPDIVGLAPRAFATLEAVSIAVFSLEYVLRLWSCTLDPRFARPIRGRLRMALTPISLIDLAVIAPFYITLAFPGFLDLRFLFVLRLLRLFRLLRIRPLGDAFAMLARVATSRRAALGVSLTIVLFAMVLAAGAIYVAEHAQPATKFTSIPRAMWWAIVTITTLGYGDMVPVTALGRVIGGGVALVGIGAIALPVGIISSGYVEELNRDAAGAAGAASCPHCGNPVDG